MDSPETITAVSFCTGYAGLDLGIRRVVPGLRVIAYSEIEAYACANLVAKMEAGLLDAAPIWTNLKTFPSDWLQGIPPGWTHPNFGLTVCAQPEMESCQPQQPKLSEP